MPCVERHKLKLVFTCVALALAVFDVGSDIYGLSEFIEAQESDQDLKLTIALGCICLAASIIFVFDVIFLIRAIKLLRRRGQDSGENEQTLTKEQKSLAVKQEIVSFFQMVVEDFPVTIIMYVTFRKSSCKLFLAIFEDGIVGNLTLLAAFLSSLWKIVSTCNYCCCAGYKDIRCSRKCCCCCCRWVRGIIAIMIMGFAAFLFFTFNREGTKYRSECAAT